MSLAYGEKKMTNFQMFVQYGTKMVNQTKPMGVTTIGLYGSDLTRKQIKAGLKKIAKATNRRFTAAISEHAATLEMKN